MRSIRSVTFAPAERFETPSKPSSHSSIRSLSETRIAGLAQEQDRCNMAVAESLQPGIGARDERMMDTRTPTPPTEVKEVQSPGSEKYKPDLSGEIAMLSTKLINAINYQTNLDDTLQSTRHELEMSQMELKRVRAERQSLNEAIAQGVLVKKSEVDREISKLKADVILERDKREIAEKAKRQTEAELENLTSSLFEEANKMVANARKETEAAERRNAQLRGQLDDTGTLLASQQEQLQDLKLTMTKLETVDLASREPSVPSTPTRHSRYGASETLDFSTAPAVMDLVPDHPLHFAHLLSPVLRTDVSSFTDFAELLAVARKGALHSRNASGNVPGNNQTNLSAPTTSTSANNSSPNLPGAFAFNSSDSSNSPSSSSFSNSPTVPSLKEFKFYKRALVEDIEPTLRLDLAPGLSFLSRRTVQSALLNGNLVVEPFAQTSNWKFYSPVFACALCGESRKTEPYTRRFRFRTSESDDAQRYPLCDYCLGRVRAAGDFIGFMRVVRDGHWKCGNEDEEQAAWAEAVKLRERMFWARIGGGVVPAGLFQDSTEYLHSTSLHPALKATERHSLESIPEQRSRRPTVVDQAEAVTPEEPIHRTPEDVQQVPEAMLFPSDEPESQPDTIETHAAELKRRTILQSNEGVAAAQLANGPDEMEAPPVKEQHAADELELEMRHPDDQGAVHIEARNASTEPETLPEHRENDLQDGEEETPAPTHEDAAAQPSTPPSESVEGSRSAEAEPHQLETRFDSAGDSAVERQDLPEPVKNPVSVVTPGETDLSDEMASPAISSRPAAVKQVSGVLARVRAMEGKQ